MIPETTASSPGISRRRFIAATSLLTAAAPLPGLSSSVGAAKKIRTGFLGCGYSHFKDKHALVKRSKDFDLVGICEPDDSTRQKGPAGTRWLSQAELFDQAELVIVESRVKNHGRDAIAALRAGRDVHVEKPPAHVWADFQEMIRLAREKNRVLQVGYMWRYHPGISRIIDAVRAGWLGEVFMVRATMNTQAGADQRREWAEFRGGAMFEQGCHLIDPLIRLLGKPSRIEPFLQQTRKAKEDALADNTVAVFEFQRAVGVITSAPLQPNAGRHRFFEVLGSNGIMRVSPLEPAAMQTDLGEAAGPYPAGPNQVSLPAYQRYVDEFAELAQAVRREVKLPVDLDEELRIEEAVLRACSMMS